MPTIKQKQALSKMVENGGNISQAMIDVGYSPNTAKTPQKLTQSLGYSYLLRDYGLTEDLVISALVEDINNKPGKRLGELTLASDVLGLRRKGNINANQFAFDKEETTQNITFSPNNLKVMKLIKEAEDILKEELLNR